MRLGIDFGTTRTAVAAVDRGNYPVVTFHGPGGTALDWCPGVIAHRDQQVVFGLEALECLEENGWRPMRSMKRVLGAASPEACITIGAARGSALDFLTGYLQRLRQDLVDRSNLDVGLNEAMQVAVAVPANANNNQRFLTIEAFRRAGFEVLAMVNEPTAAGIEYAHRYGTKTQPGQRDLLVVYDLGGGTFDVSVIGLGNRRYEVVSDEGIRELGGDDFDALLMQMVAEVGGLGDLPETTRYALLEECRERKEALHPNTRKLVIDLGRAVAGGGEVVVPAADYYQRCSALVESTIAAVERAVESAEGRGIGWDQIAAVYVVGGGSELPLVGRMLREHYGRRVRRSAYPHAATAVGLAIVADGQAPATVQERFTRYFGVWRESEAGERISFDAIFPKGTPLPISPREPLVLKRIYSPVHNIGHFRYLECGRLAPDGQPDGDITPWREIRFPFDPDLWQEADLDRVPVRRDPGLQHLLIEEQYECDATGILRVTIVDHSTGRRRSFRLGPGGVPDGPSMIDVAL